MNNLLDLENFELTRRDFIKSVAVSTALVTAGMPKKALAVRDKYIKYSKGQCRFCGTGCSIIAGIKDNKIVSISGDPDSPINQGRICIKGYFLTKILYGKDRLTHPLLKNKSGKFEKIKWPDAIEIISNKFIENIKKYGKNSVAWYGSGQNTTQEAYAANKFFKGIIGTANLEGNPRLCMASAVGGYLNTFGSDEPAGSYDDLDKADCFLIIGANPAECHPMLFRRIVNRKTGYKDRTKIICIDPRTTETAKYADIHLKINPGFDMHILNSMAYVCLKENLIDNEHLKYCRVRTKLKTEGKEISLEEYKNFLEKYRPDRVAEISGVKEEDIVTAARYFGRKGYNSVSLWTMGVNQRTQGVEINCLLHNLHLITGKIGKLGSDSLSLTGQMNACGGTREQGGLSHLLPGHRMVVNLEHRKQIADIWGMPVESLPDKPTGTAVNMFNRLEEGKIKLIWINCTNPVQSLPNSSKYIKAMKEAFTIVSDVYPTETTKCASIILPSAFWIEKEGICGQTDRRSQLTLKAVDGPGEVKSDFWQIKEIAKKVAKKLNKKIIYKIFNNETGEVKFERKVYGLGFETEEEAWNEYRKCTKGQDVDLWGATYEKLKAHSGGVQWPCPDVSFNNRGSAKRYISKKYAKINFDKTTRKYKTGYVTLYDQHLEQENIKELVSYYGHHPLKGKINKAVIRVLEPMLDYEMPDKEYPFVLNTGRVIEHWHSGTITMRVRNLRELVGSAYVEISKTDAKKLKIKDEDNIRLKSRRGEIILRAWITERAKAGMVFVPWFDETKLINFLTVADKKSWSKAGQPDFKVCAIKIEKA